MTWSRALASLLITAAALAGSPRAFAQDGSDRSAAERGLPGPLGAAVAPLMAHAQRHGPDSSAVMLEELRGGLTALHAGSHRQAALALARAVQEQPRHPAPAWCLGVSLLRLGRARQGVDMLARAVRLAPASVWSKLDLDLRALLAGAPRGDLEADDPRLQALALILERFGGDRKAAAKGARAFARRKSQRDVGLRTAIERLFPPDREDEEAPDPYVDGVLRFHKNKFREAGALFAAAYVEQPSFARGAYFHAHALFAEGRYDLAAAALIRALTRHEKWADRHISLREFYGDSDTLDAHLDGLGAALRKGRTPEKMLLMGYMLYADGQFDAARALLTHYVAALGTRRAGLRAHATRLADWCETRKREAPPRRLPPPPRKTPTKKTPNKTPIRPPGTGSGKPVPIAHPQPGPDPDDPNELLELAAVDFKAGRLDRARARVDKILEGASPPLRAHVLRTVTRLARGEYEAAGRALRAGLKGAAVGDVRLDLDRYFATRAAFEKHLARLDKHVEANGKAVDALLLAGAAHHDLGRHEKALGLFTAILWTKSDDGLAGDYIELISKQVAEKE